MSVIKNWGPCWNLSEVRAFLRTVRLLRIFISQFAKRADALTRLTQKGVQFEFGEEQLAAQEDLKRVVLTCPAIKAIDYTSEAPVKLAVDTSNIAIQFFFAQQDPSNPKIKTYGQFGSITLNDRE